jgi:hypothetical protein
MARDTGDLRSMFVTEAEKVLIEAHHLIDGDIVGVHRNVVKACHLHSSPLAVGRLAPP